MKNIKKAAFAVIGAATLMMPLGMGVAHAAQEFPPVLRCATGDEVQLGDDSPLTCDLSVDKQVSINGGPYVEADTSADAAQATVGDTVTWKITVDLGPHSLSPSGGYVYVEDSIPSGFDFVSYTASAGTYGVWGGPNSDIWAIPMLDEGDNSTLPATLFLTTTSTSTGLFDNKASLKYMDPPFTECEGCAYLDGDSGNDWNDAWVDPSAKPVVLAESTTLTNTGSGVMYQTLAAGGLAAASIAALALGRKQQYKIDR